jgi:AhpD family alkylhydroperoxidase
MAKAKETKKKTKKRDRQARAPRREPQPAAAGAVAAEHAAAARPIDHFHAYRRRMNDRILAADHIGIKRFFNLDTAAYRDGALPGRIKELLGLAASAVLRCNDCIDYHLDQCVAAGFSDAELHDALNVALVVGGSIVIPHLRHAFDTIDQLRSTGDSGGAGGAGG